jgi:hypothetical protein
MTIALLTVLQAVGLLCAVMIGPFLLVRLLYGRLDALSTAAWTGFAAMGLNTVVPVWLCLCKVPLTGTNLAIVHLASAGILIVVMLAMKRDWLPADRSGFALVAMLWAGFAVLVFPFTHLAGIDTYKWQDLATSVVVEERIPWLIYPGALFGFAPRSYPSAQPLFLASVQAMGSLSVEAGYYVTSLVSGWTGIAAAAILGRDCFGPAGMRWLPLLYCMSPVFMRYNHWATGRGFALALLPLFLAHLQARVSIANMTALAATGILLALSHKAGLIACLAIPLPYIVARFLPGTWQRVLAIAMLVPAVLISVILAMPWLLPGPTGMPLGAAKAAITRFGVLFPMAMVGSFAVLREERFKSLRPWLIVSLALLPMAFTSDMYSAMLLAPAAAILACAGSIWIADRPGTGARMRNGMILILLAVGALAVVLQRSVQATPRPVWKAALFLDQYDPDGPFRIEAPGRITPQMQAYVRGCPRFTLSGRPSASAQHPPRWNREATPSGLIREWTDWLRDWVKPNEFEVSWYGDNPRTYYVTRDKEPKAPAGARRIYDADGMAIFEPAGPTSTVPRATSAE